MPSRPPAAGLNITYDDLLKRLDTITTRLTDKLRTLALGVVAFCWALLTAKEGIPQALNTVHHHWVLWTAIIAILGLLFDLLQSLLNYVISAQLRLEMEATQSANGSFDTSTRLYKFQQVLFWAKNLSIPLSCASLLVLLLTAL